MTIEHLLSDILEPGATPWRYNSEGHKYLPWEHAWFQRCGLLYATNCDLGKHGIHVGEVYEEPGVIAEHEVSLGINFVYNGGEPLPAPNRWDDPRIRESHRRFNIFIRP